MKYIVSALASVALLIVASVSHGAEIPFDQSQFDAAQAAGKPTAVIFHAWWCPTCRAQAPVLKELSESPEFSAVTVYVANYDKEKVLKRSLAVTKQSTVVVFKNGKESARSTGDTQAMPLAALLRHAIS